MTSRDPNWRQQLSTRIAFLIAGIGFSTLAPLIPTIKARFDLNEGSLGLLLFCIGLGSLMVMPFGGALTSRFGCRKVILCSSLAFLASLPALIFAPSPILLALALLVMGAGGGTLDVAMNIQAVIVEEESKRPMMSGFHGLFSVGGIIGAGALTALLSFGLKPQNCQLLVSIMCLALILLVTPSLLPRGPQAHHEHAKGIPWPRGQVLLIGVLCLIVFAAEGSVADWGGVLLTKFRNVGTNQAGMGYIAFAAMMTLNRLAGDRIVAFLGPRPVVFFGGLVAATGFAMATFLPFWFTSVLGFACVGLGLANVVPILFSATGKQSVMPANLALSAASTMGYVGLLVGPPVLGFIARASTLLVSMAFLAILCVSVALCARRVTES